MTAYLIVRSVVPEEDRDAFDAWYHAEHLPDGRRTLGAIDAYRGWSDDDPAIHFAFYRFADLSKAKAALSSPGIRAMIAEYDRIWQNRVTRTREIVEMAQFVDADSTTGKDWTP